MFSSDKQVRAQNAYTQLDVKESTRLHSQSPTKAPEDHSGSSAKYLKSIVYGGLDGIITTFAVVASIAGAGLDTGIVIIMGFASLIADGISMGMGDYISSQAEVDYTNHERRRELWEYQNYVEGEKSEMVEIYTAKGMTLEDATTVVNIMSRYQNLFVDTMMVEELGLMPVDPDENPMKNGAVTFVSFLVFGFVPMAAYIVAVAVGGTSTIASFDVTFIVASIMTLITMFILGAITAIFSTSKWYIAGTWMLVNGGGAAISAYLIGWGLAEVTGQEGH